MEQTTDSSSLDSIAARIEARLSTPVEDSPATTTQPEPTPAVAESQQAPAAPSEESEASEQADVPASEEAAPEPEQPQKFTVKVDGKDTEVTLEDLKAGYSFTEHNTRRAQQNAEERKALEAERQKFQAEDVATVRAQRSQYESQLAQLSEAIQAVTPKEPDWNTLRLQVPPEEFAAEVLNWQQNTERLKVVEAERARVKAEQDADAANGFRQYVATEREKLAAALPVFADAEKGPVHQKRLVEFAKARGFTDDDLSKVVDHRLVMLLNDSMELAESKAKAPEITNKIEKVLATSQPGSRTTAPPKNELAAARARLRQSGSIDDAADAIFHKFNQPAKR
jgi:hypothetical protein